MSTRFGAARLPPLVTRKKIGVAPQTEQGRRGRSPPKIVRLHKGGGGQVAIFRLAHTTRLFFFNYIHSKSLCLPLAKAVGCVTFVSDTLALIVAIRSPLARPGLPSNSPSTQTRAILCFSPILCLFISLSLAFNLLDKGRPRVHVQSETQDTNLLID